MKEMNLSKEVCEQLAQQLVKEQAELVKQDAVVNGLKDAKTASAGTNIKRYEE